jgi:hypothetical protein
MKSADLSGGFYGNEKRGPARWLGAARLLMNLVILSFVSGGFAAGNAFGPPVRAPGDQTIPSVSAPPGNPGGFQARADFFPPRQKTRARAF